MSNIQKNTNAVIVASFPPADCEREACELRSSPRCEVFTRTVAVDMPAGVVPACPTCAEAPVGGMPRAAGSQSGRGLLVWGPPRSSAYAVRNGLE